MLIAYGREYVRPRPYKLEALAAAAGMSISGTRTAYGEDEIAEAGDIAVAPSTTPGGLACLYQAYCTGCGATYPGPFRVQPAPGHQAAA